MPVLKNPKHEAFIQSVFKGATGRKAYRDHVSANGSAAVSDSAASRLLNSVKVRARLTELQERTADRAVINKSMLIKGVLEVTEDAKKNGVHTAALRGYELLGREYKTFTERKNVTVRRLADLSEEELEEALAEFESADEGPAQAGDKAGAKAARAR